MISTSKLDAEELLHLAIRCSQESRHEEAIAYLKQALEDEPDNAKVRYMLGAEHAEIGMYDRAAKEMAEAVKLDSSLVAAQFQLGLLHITSGRVAEADEAWKPLERLGENNPLFLFKTGMLHLVRDEFDECISCLEKGISLNTDNAPLNKDMQRVIDNVRTAQAQIQAPEIKPAETKKQASSHILLSAYESEKDDDKSNKH